MMKHHFLPYPGTFLKNLLILIIGIKIVEIRLLARLGRGEEIVPLHKLNWNKNQKLPDDKLLPFGLELLTAYVRKEDLDEQKRVFKNKLIYSSHHFL